MKITVINGQNHKGSTYNMGKILADKLSDDVTEIFLPLDFGEPSDRQRTDCRRRP